jgi:hypothetical protein
MLKKAGKSCKKYSFVQLLNKVNKPTKGDIKMVTWKEIKGYHKGLEEDRYILLLVKGDDNYDDYGAFSTKELAIQAMDKALKEGNRKHFLIRENKQKEKKYIIRTSLFFSTKGFLEAGEKEKTFGTFSKKENAEAVFYALRKLWLDQCDMISAQGRGLCSTSKEQRPRIERKDEKKDE